jgi:hypothetical protein
MVFFGVGSAREAVHVNEQEEWWTAGESNP